MKSQTSQVARNCRIRKWGAMVQECRNRPSGMSVDEWCQANNITKANYYYRFAQVRKDCFWCELQSEHVVLNEHEDAKWLSKAQLDSVDWLPADVTLVDKIAKAM